MRRSLIDAIADEWEKDRPLVLGACDCHDCGREVALMVLALPEIKAWLKFTHELMESFEGEHRVDYSKEFWTDEDPNLPLEVLR